MALYWTDDRRGEESREFAAGGEWRDGVYVPPRQAGGRQSRISIIHDIVRTLLDLRTE
jgi:hypothetical protein